MIKGLLLVDPMQRFNVYEALNHSWMKYSSVMIVKKKFQNTLGIFGDSFENELTDLSFCHYNSIFKTDCLKSNSLEEEFQEINIYHGDNPRGKNRLNKGKYYKSRSESI